MILCLVGQPASADDQALGESRPYGSGPLPIMEQFLLSAGFLSIAPTRALVMEKGEWRVDLTQTGTNTWVGSAAFADFAEGREPRLPVTLEELRAVNGDSGVYIADGELYRTTAAIRFGLGSDLEARLSVPILDSQGGFADDWIEGFHKSLGLSDGHRSAVPQDTYTVYLRDQHGNELFRDREPSAGIGDVTISLKRMLPLRSAHWRGSVEGLVKLATGNRDSLYSSGSEDYGLQLLVGHYGDDSSLHLIFGAIHLGGSDTFSLGSQMRYGGMISYEKEMSSRSSLVLQMQGIESPFKKLKIQQLDEVSYLIDVGVTYAIGDRATLFFSFSENIVHFANSADVGLNLGLMITP